MTGITQETARAKGLRFSVHSGDSTKWYSSWRLRSRVSRYELLIEDGTKRILGAHVIGPHTEELINVFSLVIRANIGAEALEGVLFAYPTASSDISSMLE
jgi:glutathione reductase (NADPH)